MLIIYIPQGTVVKQIEIAIENVGDSYRAIVIDGFPRNKKQLQLFYERVK